MSWYTFGKEVTGKECSHELFRISGGKNTNAENSTGPWKGGVRYAYNDYDEAWGRCWADVFRVASEVLEEEDARSGTG